MLNEISDDPMAHWDAMALTLINLICKEVDIEDLPWNDGEFDYKTFVDRYKSYMKMVKKK